MTLFTVEELDEPARRKLFTIFGVTFVATRRFWINLPIVTAIGIAIALIFSVSGSLVIQILTGLGFGLVLIVSSLIHGVGHIFSSSLVNAQMKSLVLTATVYVTEFDDEEEQRSGVHIGRSIGGPALNILLGLVALVIQLALVQNPFILTFAIVNLGFGVFTLLPIPSLDGSVLLREVRNHRSDR